MSHPTLQQGDTIIAIKPFAFRKSRKGRPVNVCVGDRFWVTSATIQQNKECGITIDRIGKGFISHGYLFNPEMLFEHFEKETN